MWGMQGGSTMKLGAMLKFCPNKLPSQLLTHTPLTHASPGVQVAALMGNEGDATPFTDVTVENISSTLHQLGYQNKGWEVMYHGHTGTGKEESVAGEGGGVSGSGSCTTDTQGGGGGEK